MCSLEWPWHLHLHLSKMKWGKGGLADYMGRLVYKNTKTLWYLK